METIMSTTVEIPMSHIISIITISTVALFFGRLKLAIFLNYCFIVYSGRLWDVSLISESGTATVNTPAFAFMGFWIIMIFLAVLSLTFHKE